MSTLPPVVNSNTIATSSATSKAAQQALLLMAQQAAAARAQVNVSAYTTGAVTSKPQEAEATSSSDIVKLITTPNRTSTPTNLGLGKPMDINSNNPSNAEVSAVVFGTTKSGLVSTTPTFRGLGYNPSTNLTGEALTKAINEPSKIGALLQSEVEKIPVSNISATQAGNLYQKSLLSNRQIEQIQERYPESLDYTSYKYQSATPGYSQMANIPSITLHGTLVKGVLDTGGESVYKFDDDPVNGIYYANADQKLVSLVNNVYTPTADSKGNTTLTQLSQTTYNKIYTYTFSVPFEDIRAAEYFSKFSSTPALAASEIINQIVGAGNDSNVDYWSRLGSLTDLLGSDNGRAEIANSLIKAQTLADINGLYVNPSTTFQNYMLNFLPSVPVKTLGVDTGGLVNTQTSSNVVKSLVVKPVYTFNNNNVIKNPYTEGSKDWWSFEESARQYEASINTASNPQNALNNVNYAAYIDIYDWSKINTEPTQQPSTITISEAKTLSAIGNDVGSDLLKQYYGVDLTNINTFLNQSNKVDTPNYISQLYSVNKSGGADYTPVTIGTTSISNIIQPITAPYAAPSLNGIDLTQGIYLSFNAQVPIYTPVAAKLPSIYTASGKVDEAAIQTNLINTIINIPSQISTFATQQGNYATTQDYESKYAWDTGDYLKAATIPLLGAVSILNTTGKTLSENVIEPARQIGIEASNMLPAPASWVGGSLVAATATAAETVPFLLQSPSMISSAISNPIGVPSAAYNSITGMAEEFGKEFLQNPGTLPGNLMGLYLGGKIAEPIVSPFINPIVKSTISGTDYLMKSSPFKIDIMTPISYERYTTLYLNEKPIMGVSIGMDSGLNLYRNPIDIIKTTNVNINDLYNVRNPTITPTAGQIRLLKPFFYDVMGNTPEGNFLNAAFALKNIIPVSERILKPTYEQPLGTSSISNLNKDVQSNLVNILSSKTGNKFVGSVSLSDIVGTKNIRDITKSDIDVSLPKASMGPELKESIRNIISANPEPLKLSGYEVSFKNINQEHVTSVMMQRPGFADDVRTYPMETISGGTANVQTIEYSIESKMSRLFGGGSELSYSPESGVEFKLGGKKISTDISDVISGTRYIAKRAYMQNKLDLGVTYENISIALDKYVKSEKLNLEKENPLNVPEVQKSKLSLLNEEILKTGRMYSGIPIEGEYDYVRDIQKTESKILPKEYLGRLGVLGERYPTANKIVESRITTIGYPWSGIGGEESIRSGISNYPRTNIKYEGGGRIISPYPRIYPGQIPTKEKYPPQIPAIKTPPYPPAIIPPYPPTIPPLYPPTITPPYPPTIPPTKTPPTKPPTIYPPTIIPPTKNPPPPGKTEKTTTTTKQPFYPNKPKKPKLGVHTEWMDYPFDLQWAEAETQEKINFALDVVNPPLPFFRTAGEGKVNEIMVKRSEPLVDAIKVHDIKDGFYRTMKKETGLRIGGVPLSNHTIYQVLTKPKVPRPSKKVNKKVGSGFNVNVIKPLNMSPRPAQTPSRNPQPKLPAATFDYRQSAYVTASRPPSNKVIIPKTTNNNIPINSLYTKPRSKKKSNKNYNTNVRSL